MPFHKIGLTTLLVSLFSFATPALADSECRRGQRLTDLLIKHEAELTLPELSATSGRWRGGIGYGVKFRADQNPNYYQRQEKLNFSVRFTEAITSSINLGSGLSVQAEFVRIFPRSELICIGDKKISPAMPYKPSDAPHSAQKALDLNVNDYYSFTTETAFSVSGGQAAANGVAFFGIDASYTVSGDFKLEVSEWHYISNNLIRQIIAYYHIGEIREERKLKK